MGGRTPAAGAAPLPPQRNRMALGLGCGGAGRRRPRPSLFCRKRRGEPRRVQAERTGMGMRERPWRGMGSTTGSMPPAVTNPVVTRPLRIGLQGDRPDGRDLVETGVRRANQPEAAAPSRPAGNTAPWPLRLELDLQPGQGCLRRGAPTRDSVAVSVRTDLDGDPTPAGTAWQQPRSHGGPGTIRPMATSAASA